MRFTKDNSIFLNSKKKLNIKFFEVTSPGLVSIIIATCLGILTVPQSFLLFIPAVSLLVVGLFYNSDNDIGITKIIWDDVIYCDSNWYSAACMAYRLHEAQHIDGLLLLEEIFNCKNIATDEVCKEYTEKLKIKTDEYFNNLATPILDRL